MGRHRGTVKYCNLQWIPRRRRLEAVASAMKKKGRVQEGADADLTLFDPARIRDRSTCTQGDIPSEGIVHVLVGGTPVVRDGQVVEGIFPGQAVTGKPSSWEDFLVRFLAPLPTIPP